MSFVQTDLAGEPIAPEAEKPQPIVVSAGIPGFRVEMPVTTPAREKVLALAVMGAGAAGLLTLAGLFLYVARSKKR